jgi:hypothetical protein
MYDDLKSDLVIVENGLPKNPDSGVKILLKYILHGLKVFP